MTIKTENSNTKEISYGYPGSVLANRLGYSRTGVFVVTVGPAEGDYENRPVVWSGIAWDAANDAMSLMPEPVGFYSMTRPYVGP